jgi:hypothetical protein
MGCRGRDETKWLVDGKPSADPSALVSLVGQGKNFNFSLPLEALQSCRLGRFQQNELLSPHSSKKMLATMTKVGDYLYFYCSVGKLRLDWIVRLVRPGFEGQRDPMLKTEGCNRNMHRFHQNAA